MRKLADLVRFFIKDCNFTAAENVKSYSVIDEYLPCGDYLEGGICAYDQTYRALIIIERFPCQRYTQEHVLSILTQWIFNNDPILYRRKIETGNGNEPMDLDMPGVNIDPEFMDDETGTLTVIIPFREPVFWIEDLAGAFEYQGKKYRLANPRISQENFERDYILKR